MEYNTEPISWATKNELRNKSHEEIGIHGAHWGIRISIFTWPSGGYTPQSENIQQNQDLDWSLTI